MLKADSDTECTKILALVIFNLCGIVIAQFDNYYNWPDTSPPVVKTETHAAGKETRIRCHIKERFRHIQNGLNLTWEHKSCRAGYAGACMENGEWRPLCGTPGQPCPPILTLVEPQTSDSGLYRCHITLDTSVITPNIYMLQFVEKRREPPTIVDGMNNNLTVVAQMVAVLQCKVHSLVPPTVRWFRRLDPPPLSTSSPTHNFIQYLNNTYKLLNCCPVAALSQRDLYLSKLVISASSLYDSGFYICLAINDVNYTYKEAYINVLPILRVSSDKADSGSFLGLFLIPAALAMIPAVAWVMCLRPRKLAALESPVQPRQTHTCRQSVPTHTELAPIHRIPLLPTCSNTPAINPSFRPN
uniref:Ig-like domain-containing protein n=1 Tax=Cuerna arida TaxID=1464854 RepID=A0A1B6F579_9HEMI